MTAPEEHQRPGVDPRYLTSAHLPRLTVEVAERHFTSAEEPAGLLVDLDVGERGLVLATNETHLLALVVVERRPPLAVYVPWLKLRVTGRRLVPAEALPEAFR